MKFVYAMPFHSCPPHPAFLSQNAIVELAGTAEELGFSAASFTEHPIPTESWRQAHGHDAIDPFVGLTFAASATKRLRLLTNLIVLPYRNPFLLAKSVATIDVLSGGRLILGVGLGYQELEYAALGVNFEERHQLFEESIRTLKLALTGAPVNCEGIHFKAHGVTSQPAPAQRPHPPIWIGGNAKVTMRRIVEHAQGWLCMATTPEQAPQRRSVPLSIDTLPQRLEELHALAAATGRIEPIDLHYVLASHRDPAYDEILPRALRLAEIGVTWASWSGRSTTIDGQKAEMREFSERVISKF